MNRSAIGPALALMLFSACAGTSSRTPRPLDRQLEQTNLEAFDSVWTTVHDKYWDAEFDGLDWSAVREELRPQAADAGSAAELRGVLGRMLERLGQSHFAILPANVYADVQSEQDHGNGTSGLGLRTHDGEAYVFSVDEESPAAEMEIQTGWRVVSVDGKQLAPVIRRVLDQYGDSTLGPGMASLAAETLLRGKVGNDAVVEFLDGEDVSTFLDVPRSSPTGTTGSIGHLGTMHLDFKSRRMIDVGYIGFNVFIDPPRLMTSFAEAIESHREAKGIVLDLRGNPGGIVGIAMGIGGWLVSEPNQYLGTMSTRDTELRFVLNPRRGAYGGPLAVLVDGRSMSTSEILAAGLQDLGRARVFGSRTAGAALPSVIERLPGGDGFQYAFAHYVSRDGDPLEGRGVIPDVEVPVDRKALLAGQDPVIDAAVAWIRSVQSPEISN